LEIETVFFADGSGEKSEGKRIVRGLVFGLESFQKDWFPRQKPGFSGDFQEPNLTMRENSGAKSFQQALI
jgi:hypothetical protein